MKRPSIRLSVLVVTLAVMASTVRAQFVVYDPTNYVEAVLQYEQLLQQYQFLLQQARRLPVEMGSRYHGHSIDWTNHNLRPGLLYAQPLLAALNEGDTIVRRGTDELREGTKVNAQPGKPS